MEKPEAPRSIGQAEIQVRAKPSTLKSAVAFWRNAKDPGRGCQTDPEIVDRQGSGQAMPMGPRAEPTKQYCVSSHPRLIAGGFATGRSFGLL